MKKAKVTVESCMAPPEPESIFFKGNLVVSHDRDRVVLVTASIGDMYNTFKGLELSGDFSQSNNWAKQCFKKFRGRVILSTEDS